jgi:DNA repair exonuclease SbcCD nuclease subunit
MRILIAADVHCGLENKLNDCMWALRTIREYAKENDINVVVILGDLFHNRVNLNIKVITEVVSFLDDTKYEYGQEWLIFPGNHDMFMRHTWDVNSLKPIRRLITLIDDVGLVKIGDRRFRIVPFIQNEKVYMNMLRHFENQTEDGDILLTHIGVSNAVHNSCFLLRHWSVVDFSDTKFDKVFAGHFHCGQHFDKVYIPGSPIPFRFDEGMVKHGFYDFNCDNGDTEFIDINKGIDLIGGTPPPDFITINEADIHNADVNNKNVRVVIGTKSRDELNRIRCEFESRGATKVSWMKVEEQDREMPTETAALDPISLFEKYVGYDNPKGLDRTTLVSLNKKVVEDAFKIDDSIDE